MNTVSGSLQALNKSPFRQRFALKDKELRYFSSHGKDVIRNHAYDLITRRLAPAVIPNDGRQTPMKNHPVFIAQHATATCCRGCLAKWHKIPKGRRMTHDEIEFVVDLIMTWIDKQVNNS